MENEAAAEGDESPSIWSMPSSFIHLHTHSAYSLAEGAIPVKKLKGLCEAAQMPALAVTDTNNLFGALEVAETFAPAGIQPIVGIELAVAMEQGNDPRQKPLPPAKLVLLAQNEVGYLRLMDLASQSFLKPAQTGDPSVAFATVLQKTDGLICLSGGLDGPLDRALRYELAKNAEHAFSADRAEGLAAFAEKRKPSFQGR